MEINGNIENPSIDFLDYKNPLMATNFRPINFSQHRVGNGKEPLLFIFGIKFRSSGLHLCISEVEPDDFLPEARFKKPNTT